MVGTLRIELRLAVPQTAVLSIILRTPYVWRTPEVSSPIPLTRYPQFSRLVWRPLELSVHMVRVRGLEPPEYSFLDCSLCHSSTPAYVRSNKKSCPCCFITTALLRNSDKYLISWLDLSEEYIS